MAALRAESGAGQGAAASPRTTEMGCPGDFLLEGALAGGAERDRRRIWADPWRHLGHDAGRPAIAGHDEVGACRRGTAVRRRVVGGGRSCARSTLLTRGGAIAAVGHARRITLVAWMKQVGRDEVKACGNRPIEGGHQRLLERNFQADAHAALRSRETCTSCSGPRGSRGGGGGRHGASRDFAPPPNDHGRCIGNRGRAHVR